MTIENWLGEDNKLGIDIWNRKYKQEDNKRKDADNLAYYNQMQKGGQILCQF